MKRLILIRHGATPCTMAGLYCGRHDPDLIPEAVIAASRLRAHPALADAARIVTSPSRRARSTAEAIGGRHAVFSDQGLLELDFGDWEGLRPEDVAASPHYARWIEDPVRNPPPRGESPQAAQQRLVEAVERQMEQAASLLAVTHKNAIRLIVSHYAALPISSYRSLGPIPACSVTIVETNGASGRVVALGDTSHLPNEEILGAY